MPLAAEYAAMFEQLGAAAAAADEPPPPLWELPTAAAREMYRAMRPVNPELPIHSVSDEVVSGTQGDIPVRIYRPEGAGPFGVLVYYHGGGWVIGDLDTCDAACREIATLGNLVVVSADYRMAPEHVYPAAVTDAYDVAAWARTHMATLNGNGRLGVAGESAGGNLAAVVCIKARDEQGPQIDFQCLLYPVTDCDMTRASYKENGAGFILETPAMEWFWNTYCPDEANRSEPLASPMRAERLADLPPALVVTAEFDPLRDEGEAYADALASAGSRARAVRYDGLVHDFFATAAMFECSRGPFLETLDVLKQELGS